MATNQNPRIKFPVAPERKRPRIFRGPASHHQADGERIVEVGCDGIGCLLSIRNVTDASGKRLLLLSVYRADAEIVVSVSREEARRGE